jgi:hypothetical protein
MIDPIYCPPASLDASINRRAEWTPASRDNGSAALLLTATLASLEAAAELAAVRAAFGLDAFDSTITNAPELSAESEAA